MKKLFVILSVLFINQLIASDYEVRMLNSGPGGIMVFDPPVMKIKKGGYHSF